VGVLGSPRAVERHLEMRGQEAGGGRRRRGRNGGVWTQNSLALFAFLLGAKPFLLLGL
jgi:hypothetical protein